MKKIKLGVVGIGNRGKAMMKTFLAIDDYDIVALCDVYEDRIEEGVEIVKELRNFEPKRYLNYKDLLNDDDVEVVFIASSLIVWRHIHVGIYMNLKRGSLILMEC